MDVLHGNAVSRVSQLDTRKIRILQGQAVLMLEIGGDVHLATHLFAFELITLRWLVGQPIHQLALDLHLHSERVRRGAQLSKGRPCLAVFRSDSP